MPYAVHHGVGAAVGNYSPQSVSLQGLYSPWLSSSICWLYQTPDWYWRSQDPCALAFCLKPLPSKLHYHSQWRLNSIWNVFMFPLDPHTNRGTNCFTFVSTWIPSEMNMLNWHLNGSDLICIWANENDRPLSLSRSDFMRNLRKHEL